MLQFDFLNYIILSFRKLLAVLVNEHIDGKTSSSIEMNQTLGIIKKISRPVKIIITHSCFCNRWNSNA